MIWMLPLAGAAIGAMMNKRNPMQGALMGGALGATGGLLAPAAGAAAGAGAAGATGAAGGALPSAGLLGNLGTAATYGTGLGSQQTAMLAAQEAGMGGGLAGGLETAASYAKPISQGLTAANMARGLLAPQPMAPMQRPQNNSAQGAQIMAQLAQPTGMTPEQQMRMQRRKTMWG